MHNLKPVLVPVGVPVTEIPAFEPALFLVTAICRHLIGLIQLVADPLEIVLKRFFFPGCVIAAEGPDPIERTRVCDCKINLITFRFQILIGIGVIRICRKLFLLIAFV